MLLGLIFGSIVSAQVMIVGSRQPLEVMRAVFGAELNKTALYSVVICNDGAEQVDVSGGLAVQVMASHVAAIDGALVPSFAQRARRRSRLWRAAKVAEYGGLTGAVVFSGGLVALPAVYGAGSALVASVSERLTGVLGQEQSATQALLPLFLGAADVIRLGPRSCAGRLALGAYDRDIQGFSATLDLWNRKDAESKTKTNPEK